MRSTPLPLEKELPAARQIYASCERSVKQLLENLRLEGEIDTGMVTGAVKSMTESINRNPDAMLLLNTLHRKDSYELARAMDTSVLMITFGRFLQFPQARLEVLGLAGMLMDVGQVGTPQPPTSAMEPGGIETNEAVKQHVLRSLELIRNAPSLPAGVDEVVAQHHERQDGLGYPYGLVAENISIDGALAAIVDSFEDLTAPLTQAVQLSPSNALSQLHKLRGTVFHEALVEQFIQCLGIYPVGSVVELNSGEVGIVIAQNLVRRLQPRVMVILDSELNPITPQKILDLIKDPKSSSGEPYRIRRTLPRDKLPIDPEDFFL